ncbi:MAG: hypothetical protein HY599_03165 [Candidatus Omnitrophica bacterium]|nr:hypothetical protein [Candidatus Omnitrophota bacterium]
MDQASLHSMALAAFAGATAFAVAFLLTPWVRSLAVRLGRIEKPVEDRWGRRVIARLGGVAMYAGLAVSIPLWVPLHGPVAGLLAGLTLVFALGLVDDLRRMRPYTKLIAQLLIGCVVVIGGIRVELPQWPWLAVPLSVLWFVLVMNAFNLLDNMDGLAAGEGAIAAAFCALHALRTGQWTVAAVAMATSGVCLGFLRYNFPPAKIFMGDSGSHLLGLTLAALALLGSWHQSTRLLSVLAVPTLVLAVPIFDTCFVTLQRLSHRVHPFVGGTDHVSHRLAILGLSTRQTVLALYAVSAGLGAISLVSAELRLLPGLALWLSVVMVLVLVGRFLARVNVYQLTPAPAHREPAEPGAPATVIETMLLHKRRLVEILVDFCLVSSAYVFAHLLRFEGVITGDLQRLIVQSLPVLLAIKLLCFAGCGLYREVWRYIGLTDVLTVFKAVTLGSALSSLALLYLWRFQGYSRAVLVIDWMLTFLAVGGSRVAERLLDEWIASLAERKTTVLLIGAGDTGVRVLRYLNAEAHPGKRVVGFLDDDPATHGSRLHGCEVLGGRRLLPQALETYGVREVLITIVDPPGDLLREVRRCCEPRGVAWRVVTAGVTSAAS